MTYFDEMFKTSTPGWRSWYQPEMSLRDAYEAIQQIPIKRGAERWACLLYTSPSPRDS